MDCSVTDDRYLGLGYGNEASSFLLKLKRACFNVSGQFSWHNSNLTLARERDLYRYILNSS